MVTESHSLRDQHRHNTIVAIHVAAEALALEHGINAIKVDDIAAAAGISRRTFFNYFPVKEDAVLGLQSPTIPEVALHSFRTSTDDILTRTVLLIVQVNRTTLVQGASLKKRVLLRKKFPALQARFDAYAIAAEELVRPAITEHVAGNTDEAEVIYRLAGAVLRYTYDYDPDMRDSSIELSIHKFKHLLERIT